MVLRPEVLRGRLSDFDLEQKFAGWDAEAKSEGFKLVHTDVDMVPGGEARTYRFYVRENDGQVLKKIKFKATTIERYSGPIGEVKQQFKREWKNYADKIRKLVEYGLRFDPDLHRHALPEGYKKSTEVKSA